jgi:hypothetical protein
MSNKSTRVTPVYVATATKPNVETFIAAMKMDDNNKDLARQLRKYAKKVLEL